MADINSSQKVMAAVLLGVAPLLYFAWRDGGQKPRTAEGHH